MEGWGWGWGDRKGGGEGGPQRGPKPSGSVSQDLRVSASRTGKKDLHFSSLELPLTPQHANAAAHPAGLPPFPRAGGVGEERAGPRRAPELSSAPGQGSAGAGLPHARVLRLRPSAPPPLRAARAPLPVVAVISERREVLLELAVRLLEPLAQVLELAAERGLEGRVLGVHARAARPRPAPPPSARAPASPPPSRSALCIASFAPSLFPAPGTGGGVASWAGPRNRRSRWRGRWGGGAQQGGARRAQGASATAWGAGPREDGDGGPRPAAPPRRGGPKEQRVPRPSAAAQGGGEGADGGGGGGVQHKIICHPGRK